MPIHRLLILISAGVMLPGAPLVFAQDASLDRAAFDTAAGRTVLASVPLGDPREPASRSKTAPNLPRLAFEAPAPTGEASADRLQLDRAAGRPTFQSTHPSASTAKREQTAGPRQRSVRVFLPPQKDKDVTGASGCLSSRKRLFVVGEGWIVRRVTTCSGDPNMFSGSPDRGRSP
jgi:hypothetical protein